MIAVYLTTVLVGLTSAVLPVVPLEPYLVGLVATTSADPVVSGLAAALGQTIGKVLLFLSARGALHSQWLRRLMPSHRTRSHRTPRYRTPHDRTPDGRMSLHGRAPGGRASGRWTWCRWMRHRASRLVEALDKPGWTTPVVFVSAVTGVPPLLAVSLYVARTRISPVLFGAVCLAGRSLRFVLVAAAPGVVFR